MAVAAQAFLKKRNPELADDWSTKETFGWIQAVGHA
jgi:hypothetical protein